MSVKYLSFSVSIHGISADNDVVVGYLAEFLKEATRAGITGNMKDFFKFRNEFENDIEVELLEQAGTFRITGDK